MSKQNEKLFLSNRNAFLIISVIAFLFASWFSYMQLHVIAKAAFASYPKQYFLISIAKSYCTILACFLFSCLILQIISNNQLSQRYIALSYLPLVMVWFKVPLLWLAVFVLATQFVGLLTVLTSQDYQRLRSNYLTDGIALLTLFFCHLFLSTRFSPLHWKMAIVTAHGFNSEEIPLANPTFRGFLWSKLFSFSSVDYSQWAGVMNPPIGLGSPFLQLIAFVFNIPSTSVQSFHVLIMTVFFTLLILGSFGLYLFLKHAAKLNFIFALLGAYLLFFSGAPILTWSFISDGGIFMSPHAIFPFAIFFISMAYEKNDYRYALWAGVALASQFFFFSPHPEGTIYSLFFFGVYTFGLFLFSWQLRWLRKFLLATISIATFFALSANVVVPILVDQLSHNMYVFAHTGDISANTYTLFVAYIKILATFAPISLLLLFVYKRITPVYMSSLFLTFTILFIIHLSTNANLITRVVQLLHIGIHFWVPTRIGVFFYTSVFIIAMYGMDIIVRALFDLITKVRTTAIREEVYE